MPRWGGQIVTPTLSIRFSQSVGDSDFGHGLPFIPVERQILTLGKQPAGVIT
jgi:hypothetical protein